MSRKKERTAADVRRDIDSGKPLLKVDILRCFTQDLQERLDRGVEAMEGRSKADVIKAIRLYRDVIQAVDEGDADRAYAAAWKAASWSANSSLAQLVETARKQISGARAGGRAKELTHRQRLDKLAEWDAMIRDYMEQHRCRKKSVILAKVDPDDISERTYNRYVKAVREVDPHYRTPFDE